MKDGFVICYHDSDGPCFMQVDSWNAWGPIWSGEKSEDIRVFEDFDECLEIFEILLDSGFYPLTVMRTKDIDKTFDDAKKIEEWWNLIEKTKTFNKSIK